MNNIDPFFSEEKFEDTKELIRNRNSKDRQHNGKKKKGQTTIYRENQRSGNKNSTKNRG